ncbi:MBL fold metallo-hydrolase RNA specificity domain-containing protein [Streptomyces mirabilis]|uniref:MBL fold metallo-hydrolase RNA specificity domain-containing protein n=1 Tax=Streptomyces mirabilis TaxID=68239 RepID=UPI000D1BEE0C
MAAPAPGSRAGCGRSQSNWAAVRPHGYAGVFGWPPGGSPVPCCSYATVTGPRPAGRPPSATHLVHGEPDAAEALRDRIDDQLGWNAVVPCSGERVLVR